jgi:glycosyltransferase involved in cell wall biosynthesis
VAKLVIQIPCLNEEATLPATVADLPREVPGFDVVEWLVIDDGSTDRTAEVAAELGVHHVVSHGRNRGLAAAFLTGLDAALKAGADVIVNTDADNQYDASFIPALTEPVLAGRADIAIGERPIESIPEFSGVKKRLQRIGSRVVSAFAGTPIRDAASGFRAFTRDAAMRLQVFGRYTYTLETLVQAGQEGLAVVSVPIRVNPQTRESRLVKSTAQYVLRSAQTIIRSFALYRPFRFFFAVGLVPFTIGALLGLRWLLYFVVEDPYRSRLPSLVVAGVLVMVAVQIWVIAFLADLLAAARRIQSDTRVRLRRAELDQS